MTAWKNQAYWSLLRKWGFNRTDHYENSRKQSESRTALFHTDFLLLSFNKFDLTKKEIIQRLHLYMSIVHNWQLHLKAWFSHVLSHFSRLHLDASILLDFILNWMYVYKPEKSVDEGTWLLTQWLLDDCVQSIGDKRYGDVLMVRPLRWETTCVCVRACVQGWQNPVAPVDLKSRRAT